MRRNVMTDTTTQAVVQATSIEARSPAKDVPAWKELADDVESAAGPFLDAAQELTELLDRFDWEDDVPDEVQEAVSDVGSAVWEATYDVERRLRKFRAAVASADDDTN
jgi:hypothetical protein